MPEPPDNPPAVYPLPEPDDDPRFTFGLVLDVARMIEAHGYPKLGSGLDLVRLQGGIYRFLYRETDR